MMKEISWQDFEQIELRIGTIIEVEDFPEARIPAFKVKADFGPEIGIKKSSAQVTALYTKEDLMGRQIIGVVNFPAKQIGPVRSEFLLTGFIRMIALLSSLSLSVRSQTASSWFDIQSPGHYQRIRKKQPHLRPSQASAILTVRLNNTLSFCLS